MEYVPVSPEVCKEKHSHIEASLRAHTDQIGALVKSDATNTANIALLLKAVWGMFGTVAVILLGFIIWYIQHL